MITIFIYPWAHLGFFKSILKTVLKKSEIILGKKFTKKIKKIRCGISWKSTNKL